MAEQDELNETISELATTTFASRESLIALARDYPDAGFLRFVVLMLNDVSLLTIDALADLYFSPPAVPTETDER